MVALSSGCPTVCSHNLNPEDLAADNIDLVAIAQLINICRTADGLESRTSTLKLHEKFAAPSFDLARDLKLWWNTTHELVAVAGLWRLTPQDPKEQVVGRLEFEIHPQARDQGLEHDVMLWGEQRLHAIGQNLALPIVLHSGCRDSVVARRSLLTQAGFVPERYFFRLERSLSTPIPSPPIPTGWCLRAVDTQKDAGAWVEMFNHAFVDHWNYHPITVENFHYHRRLSTYSADLDLVIETPKGQLASFSASIIDVERNARLGCREGHVCILGTRRGYRRLGLARSLLLASLQQLRAAGMQTATIGVDAQNPLGALGFYESAGFQKMHCSTVYRKNIDA